MKTTSMRVNFSTAVRSLLVLGAALCAIPKPTLADEGRFLRIVGPTATTISAVGADGRITWSNAQVGSTYTVQTASSLGGATNWVDYIQMPASNSVVSHRLFDPNPPPGMVLIPAGSFVMGNCMDPAEGATNELPQHTVYVSAFYMERYLVTCSLWETVFEWSTNHFYAYNGPVLGRGPDHPVVWIPWTDAVRWCNARSEMEGLVPCYYKDAALTQVCRWWSDIPAPHAPYAKWSATGYRLPTEAEWEKAARGGTGGHRFPWRDVDTITHSQANYVSKDWLPYDVSPTRGSHPLFTDGDDPWTSPVGFFAANGYGLYDMAGNVAEWCWDYFDEWWYSDAGAIENDTRGPSSGLAPGYERVCRGGSWQDVALTLRCSARMHTAPRAPFMIGLRCVRGL